MANGLHFVCVDEQRKFYTPTLWDDRDGVEQILYPGAHSDVGGGYPEFGLSDCALADMQDLLSARGVHFADPLNLTPVPDPLGRAHTPWLEPSVHGVIRGPRLGLVGMKRSASLAARLAGGPVLEGAGNKAAIYAPGNI